MTSVGIRLYDALKREGFFGFSQLLISRFYKHLKRILIQLSMAPFALPCACILLILSPWIRIRLIMLPTNRIGEYTEGAELILSAFDVSHQKYSKKYKNIFYAIPGQPISNVQLHKMWKRTMTILPFSYLAFEIDRYLMLLRKQYRNDPFIKFFDARRLGCQNRWQFLKKIEKCHLQFTADEEQRGKELLEKMGVPRGAPFICLLARDSQFLKVVYSDQDWSYQDHRNATIDHYRKAAQLLADKGYYVIRMGKHVKDPFIVDHAHVIDYANSEFRSDFMDIYLSANCFFFISTSSGLDSVAKLFKRPVLITNSSLLDLDIWCPWTLLFIPKKMIDTKNNRILTFNEIWQGLGEAVKKRLTMKVIKQKGWQFIENTPEEISEAVEEMIGRLSGNWKYSEADNLLQMQFWNNFLHNLLQMQLWNDFLQEKFWREDLHEENPPDLKMSVFNDRSTALRMGSVFLRNHSFLLGESSLVENYASN